WPRVFHEGAYLPLNAVGPSAEHLCAFARQTDETTLVIVAPRWFSRLAPEPGDMPLGAAVWGETAIHIPMLAAGARGTNVLTGETVEAAQMNGLSVLPAEALLASFPLALVLF
ncbi:MAG: hypothetical protein ABFE02_00130, partial [Sulfuricella sp.]